MSAYNDLITAYGDALGNPYDEAPVPVTLPNPPLLDCRGVPLTLGCLVAYTGADVGYGVAYDTTAEGFRFDMLLHNEGLDGTERYSGDREISSPIVSENNILVVDSVGDVHCAVTGDLVFYNGAVHRVASVTGIHPYLDVAVGGSGPVPEKAPRQRCVLVGELPDAGEVS